MTVKPSPRRERQNVDLLSTYLTAGELGIETTNLRHASLKNGTHASLLGARISEVTLIEQHNQPAGSSGEIAYEMSLFDAAELGERAEKCNKNGYGACLKAVGGDPADNRGFSALASAGAT